MELEQTSSSLEAAAGRWKRLEGRGETKRADRVADEICVALEPLIQTLCKPHLERNPQITTGEMIQQGRVAVIGALQRYKTEAPASFVTFARTTIAGLLKHYVRDNYGGIISDPRGLYEIRPRLARAIEVLEMEGREVTPEAVAEATELPLRRVERAMETQVTTQQTLRIGTSGGEFEIDPDYLPGVSDDKWIPAVETRLALEQPFAQLPEDLKAIIGYRFHLRMSLQETADLLGLTREEVRAKEQKALRRLRRVMEHADPLDAESPSVRRLLTEENIGRLPDPHKSILLLYYHEGLSYSAIGKRLQMTDELAFDLRRRALETLQKQCQQQERKP